jgi:iron complex transport system substrate-binding protein
MKNIFCPNTPTMSSGVEQMPFQLGRQPSLFVPGLLIALLVSACTPVQPVSAPVAAMRTITDAGTNPVTVPVAPQRVVTLSEQDLDGALALDVKPVGSVNGRGQPGLPAYLGERTEGIASVGSLAEPSLEAIAALDPDLILVGGVFPALAALLPQLREIAPTVITYNLTDDWQSAFRGTAAALNKETEVEAFLDGYGKRVAELRASLGEEAGATVTIARWMPDGPVIMAHDAFASLIVRDLGWVRPEAQQAIAGYAHTELLSLEQLEQLDADRLFIGVLNADGLTALQSAAANPLFQQLDVVRQQRVVEVDGTIWTSRGGPLATGIVLNDIAAALAAP